jgi:hypothetical protein
LLYRSVAFGEKREFEGADLTIRIRMPRRGVVDGTNDDGDVIFRKCLSLRRLQRLFNRLATRRV